MVHDGVVLAKRAVVVIGRYICGTRSGRMRTMLCAAAMVLVANAAAAQNDQRVETTVYPILFEAPIFGGSINLPSLPGGGGGSEGGEQSGSTDMSLNALYMAGVSVRANRWFAEARGQWASLSASY